MATEVIIVVATLENLQLLVQSSNVAHSQGCYEPIIEELMTLEFDDVLDYDMCSQLLKISMWLLMVNDSTNAGIVIVVVELAVVVEEL